MEAITTVGPVLGVEEGPIVRPTLGDLSGSFLGAREGKVEELGFAVGWPGTTLG